MTFASLIRMTSKTFTEKLRLSLYVVIILTNHFFHISWSYPKEKWTLPDSWACCLTETDHWEYKQTDLLHYIYQYLHNGLEEASNPKLRNSIQKRTLRELLWLFDCNRISHDWLKLDWGFLFSIDLRDHWVSGKSYLLSPCLWIHAYDTGYRNAKVIHYIQVVYPF